MKNIYKFLKMNISAKMFNDNLIFFLYIYNYNFVMIYFCLKNVNLIYIIKLNLYNYFF